jgi:hypothetical protein
VAKKIGDGDHRQQRVVGTTDDSRILEPREVFGDRQRSLGIPLTLFRHCRAKQPNARYGQGFDALALRTSTPHLSALPG